MCQFFKKTRCATTLQPSKLRSWVFLPEKQTLMFPWKSERGFHGHFICNGPELESAQRPPAGGWVSKPAHPCEGTLLSCEKEGTITSSDTTLTEYPQAPEVARCTISLRDIYRTTRLPKRRTEWWWPGLRHGGGWTEVSVFFNRCQEGGSWPRLDCGVAYVDLGHCVE